jgi:beta-1,4-mannosyl-glycoprotein beta-1,4-N-acetylglucosaminyltransferase
MKIYDCFPFFNELELLEFRMEILDKHVDYFVIQEATTTFSGNKKPLHFHENRHLFKKWEHKIIHGVFDQDDEGWDHWDRDKLHKNAMAGLLTDCDNDDIILTSDVDEIPNFDERPIESFRTDPTELYHMMQNMYYYYMNCLKETGWFGTKVCSYKMFKEYNFDGLRNMKTKGIQVPYGGWHFTFLGGPERVKHKIESWGHQEFNNDFIKANVEENMKNGRDIFYRPGSTFNKVEIDESYPLYLRDNLDKYKEFIL